MYIDELRSDTEPRKQIPPSGTADQTLAHNSVIRESDPASRKLHGGSLPLLRCGQMGHRCREQDEREDGPSRELSEDASVGQCSAKGVSSRRTFGRCAGRNAILVLMLVER
jgi:hypothetical protein